MPRPQSCSYGELGQASLIHNPEFLNTYYFLQVVLCLHFFKSLGYIRKISVAATFSWEEFYRFRIETMGKKRVLVGYGIDVDAVSGWYVLSFLILRTSLTRLFKQDQYS